VVGVNRFTDESAAPRVDAPDYSELAGRQHARLTEARHRRTPAAVTAALQALADAAGTADPLMPAIIEAVRVRATIGEISDVFRAAWGRYAG
jgi:methylmalonyl-CoA mutase N-terminal domain/subunit